MKLLKDYIQYEADGYSVERDFSRERNGTITLTASAEVL